VSEARVIGNSHRIAVVSESPTGPRPPKPIAGDRSGRRPSFALRTAGSVRLCAEHSIERSMKDRCMKIVADASYAHSKRFAARISRWTRSFR